MTSEIEAYLEKILPQIKESYPKAKEREAFGQLHKLFALTCQSLTPARRPFAQMHLFSPQLKLNQVYWPSAPEVFKEFFQTDLYWLDAGLSVEIPNPTRNYQKQKVLKLEANGIILQFFREFRPDGDNKYQIEFEVKRDTPLRKNPNALARVASIGRKIQVANQDSKIALEFLELATRFALEAVQTKGFTQRKPFLIP